MVQQCPKLSINRCSPVGEAYIQVACASSMQVQQEATANASKAAQRLIPDTSSPTCASKAAIQRIWLCLGSTALLYAM